MGPATPALLPVALVLPVKNEAHTLPELFAALASAPAWPTEIVFSDAGSTDGTAQLIHTWWQGAARHGTSLQVLERPGALPGGGRNAGVAVARSEWIAFLDGGIRPEPDWLARLYAAALAGGHDHAFGLCRFDARAGAGSGVDTGVDAGADSGSGTALALAVCALTNGVGRTATVLPAALFHRRVFERIGLFEEHLRSAEDLLWLRKFAAAFGAREVCPAALVHYTHYPQTFGAVFRKWRAFERSSVTAGVGGAMRMAYIGTAALWLLLAVLAPPLALMLFLFYLLARGVADPVRRCRSLLWWRRAPAALCLAPVCALVMDSAKLLGALAGYGFAPPRQPDAATGVSTALAQVASPPSSPAHPLAACPAVAAAVVPAAPAVLTASAASATSSAPPIPPISPTLSAAPAAPAASGTPPGTGA